MANKLKDVFKYIDMTATALHGNMTTPCWPWKGKLAGNGRPYFTVDGKKVLAYAAAREAVTGEKANGRMHLHQCDNQVCCRWDHITLGTHEQNMLEMKERERHGLPHHTVRAIRKLADAGRPHSEIADLYGIGRSTVTEIVGGVSYQHVNGEDTAINKTDQRK